MIYSIKITSEDGEVIELGNDTEEKSLITDIKIHLDTINDNVSEKAMGMLAKIAVKGIISNSEAAKKKYIDLFKWSKSLSRNQWYRSLVIKSYVDGTQDVHRTYQFDNVFVVDYIEEYSTTTANNDGKKDRFELYLTQKENNLQNIDTY